MKHVGKSYRDSTPCVVGKDTVENTSKSIKLYYSMPKGTCRAEATSNSEKIKPTALALIKLCLPKLTLAVSRKLIPLLFFVKNYSNLLQGSWEDTFVLGYI